MATARPLTECNSSPTYTPRERERERDAHTRAHTHTIDRSLSTTRPRTKLWSKLWLHHSHTTWMQALRTRARAHAEWAHVQSVTCKGVAHTSGYTYTCKVGTHTKCERAHARMCCLSSRARARVCLHACPSVCVFVCARNVTWIKPIRTASAAGPATPPRRLSPHPHHHQPGPRNAHARTHIDPRASTYMHQHIHACITTSTHNYINTYMRQHTDTPTPLARVFTCARACAKVRRGRAPWMYVQTPSH